MNRYRTGNHWGVTIVREQPIDGMTAIDEQLVAVVVNGDMALAERISQLLNAAETTYDEWRVTGDPGEGFPPYQFTWTPTHGPGAERDPETEARNFMRLIASVGGWPDGPHLHRRTVTETDWEPA